MKSVLAPAVAVALALAAACGPRPAGPRGPPPQYEEPQDPVWPPSDAGNIWETSMQDVDSKG